MKNSTVLTVSVILVLLLGLLLTFNIQSIMRGKDVEEPYLKFNHVRGIAVERKGKLYTLSFKQQNDMIYFLNNSIHVLGVKPDKRTKPEIEKLVVYQFDGKPDLVITPVAYVNENLVYSAPSWNPDGYMMEVSQGALQSLLADTYDH